MIVTGLIGFTLIAGMLTRREYGCDKRLAEAQRISGVAKWRARLADEAAQKAQEARIRRITLR